MVGSRSLTLVENMLSREIGSITFDKCVDRDRDFY